MSWLEEDAAKASAYAKLQTLLPVQFKEVIFQYGMPDKYLPREGTLEEKIHDLLRYAEQQEGKNTELTRLNTVIDNVISGNYEPLPPSLTTPEPSLIRSKNPLLKWIAALGLMVLLTILPDYGREIFVYSWDTLLDNPHLHQDIAIVLFDEDSEAVYGAFGKAWRKHHAQLIRQLVGC